MGHIVDALQPGQTVLGLARDFFGEEYDHVQFVWGSETPVVGVIDTNILLNDLKHSLRVQPLTALMEAARIGALKLFASTTVRDEVWEKLGIEKITRKLKIAPVEARQRWEQDFLPWITFLDPTGLPLLSARVKALLKQDPDDVPTGQLIELLQPDVVFCYDTRHLGDFDVLADGWIHVAVAYRDISRQEGMVTGVAVTSTLAIKGTLATTQLSLAALEQARAGLERMDKKILWCLILVVGVALGFALAYSPSRRWLSEQGKALASAVKRGAFSLGEHVGEVAEAMAIVEQAAGDARLVLTEQGQRALTPPRGLREYAARALARSKGPLSLPELMEHIEDAGYQTHAKEPERSLSHMLHAHPQLFRVEDRRWSLRSHPFSGEQCDSSDPHC
jgi:hypothetical protein